MTAYFGFVPSKQLSSDIDTALAKATANNGEPLYPYRDKVAKGVNDELLNATLIEMAAMLPEGERKKSLHKHAQTIQGVAGKMLEQMLGKAENSDVLGSVDFMKSGLSIDPSGQRRTGFVLPDALARDMKKTFAAIAQGDVANQKKNLATVMKQFADLALQNYIHDFNKTLNLGLFKRGAASMAHTAIEKVLHLVINSMIPSLSDAETQQLAAHYDRLIYKA